MYPLSPRVRTLLTVSRRCSESIQTPVAALGKSAKTPRQLTSSPPRAPSSWTISTLSWSWGKAHSGRWEMTCHWISYCLMNEADHPGYAGREERLRGRGIVCDQNSQERHYHPRRWCWVHHGREKSAGSIRETTFSCSSSFMLSNCGKTSDIITPYMRFMIKWAFVSRKNIIKKSSRQSVWCIFNWIAAKSPHRHDSDNILMIMSALIAITSVTRYRTASTSWWSSWMAGTSCTRYSSAENSKSRWPCEY